MTLLDLDNADILRRSCAAHDGPRARCEGCARVERALSTELPSEEVAARVRDRILAYFMFLALEGLSLVEDELDVAELYEETIADALEHDAGVTADDVERWHAELRESRSYAIPPPPEDDERHAPGRKKRERKREPTGWPVGRPAKGCAIQGGLWPGAWKKYERRKRKKKRRPVKRRAKERAARAAGVTAA